MPSFLINSKKFGPHIVEVDADDLEKVSQYTWHVHYSYRNGRAVLKGARTDVKIAHGKKKLLLHKLILIGETIDHKDGNPLNNKKENLRVCSSAENTRNCRKRKNNTAGFKGVSWHKRYQKFTAQIGYDKRKIHLGYFNTAKDAARAYNQAALKYHGEFARLNVI